MKLITNPDRFFSELKIEEISIRKPMVIVIALTAIVSIQQFLVMTKIAEAFPSEVSRFLMVGAYTGIIGSFIGMFAVWLILAGVMHALSSLLDGNGSFRRTFEFTGYGYLPSLMGSLVTVPLSSYYVLNAKIPHITSFDPETMKSIIPSLMPTELIYTNLMVNTAITLWGLTIWVFAVKHARNLTTKNAFITALIPTTLFAVYQIYSVVKLL
jgi:hypothetical protein